MVVIQSTTQIANQGNNKKKKKL